MQGEHIVRPYDEELTLLKTKISEMIKAVEVGLNRAVSENPPLALSLSHNFLRCSNLVPRCLIRETRSRSESGFGRR